MNHSLFSVVIPVYNDPVISKCLAALFRCDVPPGWKMEVIVVDDGSFCFVSDRMLSFPVRYIRIPHSGQASARNKGIQEARGEVIACLDSDCVPDISWVREAVQSIQRADVVAGRISHAQTMVGDIISLSHFGIFSSPFPCRVPFFCSGNVVFRRSVLQQAVFPLIPAGEDTLLSWRLSQAGILIAYNPALVVVHDTETSWRYLFRVARRQARASVLIRRHDQTLPGSSVPRIMWPFVRLFRDYQRLFRFRSSFRIPWALVPAYMAVLAVVRAWYAVSLFLSRL